MKNKFLCIMAVCMILLTSGCGNNNYLIDQEDNIILNPTTGQQLRNDILCRPSAELEIYSIYEEYEDQLENPLLKLPTCEKFLINSNESESMWEFIFVKPTAFAITKIGNLVGNLGIAVILVGILIRLLLLPLQMKTSVQSHNMKKAAPEIKKIEKKYANTTDKEAQLAKSYELMALYKKYSINPLTGCLPALIQLPVFFAFLDAIYRLPSIYEQSLFGFNLGMTPSKGISNNEYQYVFLMILIGVSTYYSFKHTMKQNPQTNDEQGKQMKTMLNFMTVFILFSSLLFPTALHFYWIITYAFIAIQTTVINKYLLKKEMREMADKKTKVVKKSTEKGKKSEKNNSKEKIKSKLDKKEGKK